MKDYNTKKNEQLGMPHGTAANKLRKLILFKLLKELSKNYCFQCGAEIKFVEELSIEHKVPWLDSEDPKKLFFDLDNISFSHLSCNVGAARPKEVVHPSRKAYQKGCRCNDCVAAFREYGKKWMKKKRSTLSGNSMVEYRPDTA